MPRSTIRSCTLAIALGTTIAGCTDSRCEPCVGDIHLRSDDGGSEAKSCSSISGSLFIANLTTHTMPGLQCLESVEGTLTIAANPALQEAPTMDRLTQVGGSFHIASNPMMERLTVPHLSSIGGLVLEDTPSLDTNGLELGNTLEISGDLSLEGTGLTDATPLSGLTLVEGGVSVGSNPALESLDGLEALSELSHLYVSRNPVLASLDGLASVVTIDDSLIASHNDALTALDGLASLESVGGHLVVADNPQLERLGLDALHTVHRMRLNDNPRLVDTALPALVRLDGLFMMLNDELEVLGPMPVSGLTGGAFRLDYHQRLRDISTLKGLRSAYSVNITGMSALDDLSGLSGLEAVAQFQIWGNPGLKRLAGLDSLQSVAQDVTIRYNDLLCPEDVAAFLATVEVGGQLDIGDNGEDCP